MQDESHYQEIRKYGPLHLLQSIKDDNRTFHLLKDIQDESHYREIRKYGPLHLLQSISPISTGSSIFLSF